MQRITARLILFCTAAALAVPASASAATVFDQGPLLNNGGVRSIFWNADDFTLPTATTLTGATFNLVQDTRQPADYYNPNISYALYSDLNGSVGALLQTGSAVAQRTPRALPPYAGISFLQFYAWQFDFAAPFAALADTRYWVGVQQSDDIALGLLENGANPGASAEIAGNVAGPYGQREPGLAFSLQGEGAAPPGAVPEAATWAMMIVGFGAVGGAMRRRRRIVARVRYA